MPNLQSSKSRSVCLLMCKVKYRTGVCVQITYFRPISSYYSMKYWRNWWHLLSSINRVYLNLTCVSIYEWSPYHGDGIFRVGHSEKFFDVFSIWNDINSEFRETETFQKMWSHPERRKSGRMSAGVEPEKQEDLFQRVPWKELSLRWFLPTL